MLDSVQISNMALARLGARSIVSLTEDSTGARECARVYEHARDSEIRLHPWGFARARAVLAALSEAPAFGAAYQYQLPADCLRIITSNGRDGRSEQSGFQVEGRRILTDLPPPLELTYIRRVEDPTEFDAAFVEVLVCRMALDMAEKLTNSNSKKQEAAARLEDARRSARRVNGFEAGPIYSPESSWVTARY